MTCSFREPYLSILLFISLPPETKDRVEKDKQQGLGKTAWANHDRVRGNHGTVYVIIGGHINTKLIRNSFFRQSACLFFFLVNCTQNRL